MTSGDGFSDGLFRGFLVGAMIGALIVGACGCGFPRDDYARAAEGLPSCWAPGVVFAVPPAICPELLRIWRLSEAEFGARPPGTWRVMASGPPEPFVAGGKTWTVWGNTYCDTGRIVVAEHPGGWCASSLAHEFAHALRCREKGDGSHPVEAWGDPKNPAEGTLYRGIYAVGSECQWEAK